MRGRFGIDVYKRQPAYLIVGGAVLAVLMVYPFGRKAAQDQLRSIGLVNRAEMVPELLRKRQDKEHPRVTVWEFRNQSIPLAVWEEKQAALEAALDVSIVKIIYGKSKSRVLIYAVLTQTSLPDILRWSDSYLSSDSFVLTLGESLLGPVTVNLAHIPHILLGGSTCLLYTSFRSQWLEGSRSYYKLKSHPELLQIAAEPLRDSTKGDATLQLVLHHISG